MAGGPVLRTEAGQDGLIGAMGTDSQMGQPGRTGQGVPMRALPGDCGQVFVGAPDLLQFQDEVVYQGLDLMGSG